MAQLEYEPDLLTGDVENVLRALLTKFSLSPLRSGKRIRDLLKADYGAFRAAALTVLREPMDVRGLRYLITLLWTNDLLISILGDVTLPRELGISISQTAAKVDTQLHIRLTRFLVSGMLEGRDIEEQSANRLLEILGAISDGFAIQGFLRQMLQHPNPRIRSKVSLLVGNSGRGVKTIRSLVANPEEDPRVRANAIEALWHNTDKEILEVFGEMLSDPNNRVAGNSALGLYLAGDTRSIPVVRKMVAHTDASVRQTAVWAMGKTEDPRFLPDVGRMLGEPDPKVRKAVFRAVASIKNAAARRAKNPALVLTASDVAPGGEGPTKIRLSLTASEDGESPRIPPTGFAIHVDGKPVEEFTCTAVRNEQMCAAFVLPRRPTEADPLRALIRGVLIECLEAKRGGDRWSIVRYQESANGSGNFSQFRMFGQSMADDRGRVTEKKAPLTLTAGVTALRAEIDSNSLRSENAPNAFLGIERSLSTFRIVRGARHVLVVVDALQEMDPESLEDLIKSARGSGVAIHAISTKPSPQIARICRETSGAFRRVAEIAAIEGEMKLLYRTFRSQYVVEFRAPEAGAGSAVIQAYNATAFGEATVDLTPDVEDAAGGVQGDAEG